MIDEINKIIASGAQFLEKDQRKDGSFPDFIWQENDSSKSIERHTTFPTALILESLRTCLESF